MRSFCVPQTKELSIPQQSFVAAILEGKSQIQAARDAGISKPTGQAWFKLDEVQLEIQRGLRQNRNRIRLKASQQIDDMLEVLIGAATTNGGYSKVQVDAAKAVLKYAGAESVEANESTGAKFEVIINNNTSDTAVQEQQARHHRVIELVQPNPDAAFELLEDDE